MGKVVLITGASRGLGAATARIFAKNGYDVVLNYVNNDLKARLLMEELEGNHQINCLTIRADVSKKEDIDYMVNEVVKEFGKIDVLVNNAGIAMDSVIDDKSFESFDKVLNTNLVGPFILSREVAKHMPSGSSIIMVSSTNGIDTNYSYSLDYDASKAGMLSLMHNLADIYAPKIRVNAVAPGWINTDMNKELDDEMIKEECECIALGRFAEPMEVANVIYFLASPEASYIHDTIIRVDGGLK